MKELRELVARNRGGSGEAMPSVCSANPDVLAASVLLAKEMGAPLLVEATSNQVNQFGGYTGMRPAEFVSYVRGICEAHGLFTGNLLFGGDHLGPQAWRGQPPNIAIALARDLVAEYVRAGFTKIHLDCSEGCDGEPAQAGDTVAAARAAELAAVCESAAADPAGVSYVFGTEVPPPGGARAADSSGDIAPTTPERALATIAEHRKAFAAQGIEASAWSRAIGLVVQPGLEFAADHVHRFNVNAVDKLSPILASRDGLCFEAHSTDYQAAAVFPALARRHFAVLKVGPALTYAYRQAIYALDAIAGWIVPDASRVTVANVMESLMLEAPQHWVRHYAGDGPRLRLLRHFGYADRIRYYWPHARAVDAVQRLLALLSDIDLPAPFLEQHFPPAVLERAERLRAGAMNLTKSLITAQIQEVLAPYFTCVRTT
jgi:D-tagatose-bisphosphate aldolase class II non-catalytic subunit